MSFTDVSMVSSTKIPPSAPNWNSACSIRTGTVGETPVALTTKSQPITLPFCIATYTGQHSVWPCRESLGLLLVMDLISDSYSIITFFLRFWTAPHRLKLLCQFGPKAHPVTSFFMSLPLTVYLNEVAGLSVSFPSLSVIHSTRNSAAAASRNVEEIYFWRMIQTTSICSSSWTNSVAIPPFPTKQICFEFESLLFSSDAESVSLSPNTYGFPYSISLGLAPLQMQSNWYACFAPTESTT